MIKIENLEVYGWEPAIRGMRNSYDSWDKSDSGDVYEDQITSEDIIVNEQEYLCFNERRFKTVIGPADQELMLRLSRAGSDHRKFMRMIQVYVDITAPLYLYKELDTYVIGKVQNSCSTMHSITKREFALEDFSHEHLDDESTDAMLDLIDLLNRWRERYLVALKTEEDTGLPAKDVWWQIIQLLPSSYNQKRTVMLNYEVLRNIYHARKNHKLDEWRYFCNWIETLPFSELITGPEKKLVMSVNEYRKVNGLDAVNDIPIMEKHNVTCKEENDNV